MASPKQSHRQLVDASVPAKGTETETKPAPTNKRTHIRPEGFKGDRPGFFRGARIR